MNFSRTLLSLLALFLAFSSFGQSDSPFDRLIEETNRYLTQYGEVEVFGGYYAIQDLDLTAEEKSELLTEHDFDTALTPKKDSIQAFHLIEFLQDKVTGGLLRITEHEGFAEHPIENELNSDVLEILVSEDRKLFIFSFDMKNGGTYKGEIAMMFYEGLGNSESNSTAFSQIRREGVYEIHTLNSQEGKKYLLVGGIVGCATCYESFVQLIQPKGDKLESQFAYALNLRNGWDNPIEFDPETQRISAEYETDDLTTECVCEDQSDDEESYLYNQTENSQMKKCRCIFEFNGSTFELVDSKARLINGSKD
jgi:hypothetical protein